MVKNRASQNQSAADYDSQLTRKDPEAGTEEQQCAAGIHRKRKQQGATVSFTVCGSYDQFSWSAATDMSNIFSHGCESRLVAKN